MNEFSEIKKQEKLHRDEYRKLIEDFKIYNN